MKRLLLILLLMLLVGCQTNTLGDTSKPKDTIDRYLNYMKYEDYDRVYDEILDNDTKSVLSKSIFNELYEDNNFDFDNATTECEEIINDGKHAKIYCDIRYINSYGYEKVENLKFNLVKEEGSWKLQI